MTNKVLTNGRGKQKEPQVLINYQWLANMLYYSKSLDYWKLWSSKTLYLKAIHLEGYKSKAHYLHAY
jgi:hypothetical protein